MLLKVGAQDGVVALDQAGPLLLAHMHELVPPLMGARERFAFGVALALARKAQALRHRRQHSCVDRVGLGEMACGAGKVAGPGRIDPSEGDACLFQRFAQLDIVAAGRLEQHELAMPTAHEGRHAFSRVRKTLSAAIVENIQMVLGDIDSNKARVYDHGCLSLCCEVRCKRPRSTVQVGWFTDGRGSSPLTVFQGPGTQRSPARTQHGTLPTHRELVHASSDLLTKLPIALIGHNRKGQIFLTHVGSI